MKSIEGQKRGIQFYNSASVETDASELNYVVIAATDQMLDEIGGLIYASGARFPSDETIANTFRFNKITAQELIWIGLQLMGASQLDFDADWSNSPDSDFHAVWEQDTANKGHWSLHLKNPEITDGTDGREIELQNDGTYISWRYIGDSVWNNLVSIASLTGAPGTDGSDGADGSDGSNGNDGREIELRVSAGFIQWEFTTGDTWHNLIDVSDLVGAKGDKGDTGDKGDKGDTGDTGKDGGDSPSDTPDSDPSTDTRCAVATECANELKRIFVSITNVNSTTRGEITAGTAGIGVIMAIIFPGAAVAIGVMGAAVGLYNTLLGIEANGYIPYFNTDILVEIQCQLFCILDDTGKYDADTHTAWTNLIKANPDGLHQAMGAVLDQATFKPFQWAAISAPLLAAPDCNSCGCGWVFKALNGFHHDSYITSNLTGDGCVAATYNSGTDLYHSDGSALAGHNCVGYDLTIALGEMTEVTFVKFTVRGNWELSGSSGFGRAELGGTQIIDEYQSSSGDHTQSFQWTGAMTVDTIHFGVDWFGTFAEVIEIVVYGSGTLPSGLA